MIPTIYNKLSSGRVEQVFQTNSHKGILRFDNEQFTTLIDGQVTFTTDKEGSTLDTNTVTTASLIAATADINAGTIDGSTIATSNITVGSGKTLDVSAGTLTLSDNQISGDKVEGGTIAATTITTLTSTTGNITTVLAGNGTVAVPSYSFTSDPNTGIISSAVNAIGFVTDGTERWSINTSGTLNPLVDNTYSIGNLIVNPQDIHVSRSIVKKGISSTQGYGQLTIKSIAASKTLTNAMVNTLVLQIPTGVKLIGVQLRNDTAITGVDDATGLVPITTYRATYVTGLSQTISDSIAVAINTKTSVFFNTNLPDGYECDITNGVTDITLESGDGNKFTAGGIISAVAYYYELTDITSFV